MIEEESESDSNSSMRIKEEDNDEESISEINQKAEREASTLIWSRFQKANKSNLVEGCFTLPSLVKTFRVYVLGMDLTGKYGVHSSWLTSQKPFNTCLEAPLFMRPKEKVTCRLTLENNREKLTVAEVQPLNLKVEIPAKGVYNLEFQVSDEDLPMKLETTFLKYNEKVSEVVDIPIFFGLTCEKSTNLYLDFTNQTDFDDKLMLELPENLIPNSLQLNVEYKQISTNLLLKGLRKMIREPHGCFEQTSAITFPMVMLMQYIDQLPEKTEKLLNMRLDAEVKMKRGIQRLLGYECSDGGFEWFGRNPGHVTLTAYGVWQFIEMNKLGDYIDPKIIDRSLDWMRKNYQKESCEFRINSKGHDAFARPPQFCSDVYILFILTLLDDYHVQYKSIVEHKIIQYEQGQKTQDLYLRSFIALVYFGTFYFNYYHFRLLECLLW